MKINGFFWFGLVIAGVGWTMLFLGPGLPVGRDTRVINLQLLSIAENLILTGMAFAIIGAIFTAIETITATKFSGVVDNNQFEVSAKVSLDEKNVAHDSRSRHERITGKAEHKAPAADQEEGGKPRSVVSRSNLGDGRVLYTFDNGDKEIH